MCSLKLCMNVPIEMKFHYNCYYKSTKAFPWCIQMALLSIPTTATVTTKFKRKKEEKNKTKETYFLDVDESHCKFWRALGFMLSLESQRIASCGNVTMVHFIIHHHWKDADTPNGPRRRMRWLPITIIATYGMTSMSTTECIQLIVSEY